MFCFMFALCLPFDGCLNVYVFWAVLLFLLRVPAPFSFPCSARDHESKVSCSPNELKVILIQDTNFVFPPHHLFGGWFNVTWEETSVSVDFVVPCWKICVWHLWLQSLYESAMFSDWKKSHLAFFFSVNYITFSESLPRKKWVKTISAACSHLLCLTATWKQRKQILQMMTNGPCGLVWFCGLCRFMSTNYKLFMTCYKFLTGPLTDFLKMLIK